MSSITIEKEDSNNHSSSTDYIENNEGKTNIDQEVPPILNPPFSDHSIEIYRDGHYAKLTNGWTWYQLFEPQVNHENSTITPRLLKNLKEKTFTMPTKFIVCFHGITWWSMSFHRLVQSFVENGYTVLLFDFYGRGRSCAPETLTYSLDMFVSQAIDLLDYLEITDMINLVGYSMGGAVATLFASTFPQRINRLIGMGPAIVPVPIPFIGKLVTMGYGVGKFLFSLFGAQSLLRKVETERFSMDIHEPENIDPLIIDDLVEKVKWLIEKKPGYLNSFHNTLCSIDFGRGNVELLTQITSQQNLKVLIILGNKDQIIPYEEALLIFKNNLPHAKIETIMNCGHAFTLEKPLELSEAIIKFLKEPL
ncbi:hypothetical protein CYY_007413 [Polysphondylium violaceum]|uniref:AB hydrolase-1 domain-containing protein n=1 Tax=Polysphondylium violaceum TaxID=133409 RepID=A0A8J4PXF4_9MYCE|nr:hypothetical protein CYY_007413 [Polysphondylium violaceum]